MFALETSDPCSAGQQVCEAALDLTGNPTIAAVADVVIGKPLALIGIAVLALVVRWALHRVVDRLVSRAEEGVLPDRMARVSLGRSRGNAGSARDMAVSTRRVQRAQTMGSLLKSIVSGVVVAVAATMMLSELGVDIAPIVASAGIIGVALGFGSQTLVKDFLSGIFMIFEDQYGVGDVVDLGEASGTVEAVGLRITRLRDVNGVVWYVRNGEILRVGNKSQGFAQVVIDMPVAHDTDLERARTAMQEVADEMYAEAEWGAVLLAEPESLGVEQITAEGVFLRLVVRSMNADQWRVGRELRMRLKERFVAEGIRTPLPLLTGASAGAR
jgi:small conductance mechanosensitive channel